MFNFSLLVTDNVAGYPILQYSSPEIVSFENNNEPLRPRVIPTGNPGMYVHDIGR